MNVRKKITSVILLLLTIFLFSCKDRCYEAEEFDTYDIEIKAKPTEDGISGSYNPITGGGQFAQWHETGLLSNGDNFIINVSGAWLPWNISQGSLNDARISQLSRCDFCAKKEGVANCICKTGETPTAILSGSCALQTDQDNPNQCSCSSNPTYGTELDYGSYFINLNYFNKDQTPRIADQQDNCKVDAGMGLYIGLFGNKGTDTPKRIYQLYSVESFCPIDRNSNNLCLDSTNTDRTKYVFRSANDRIFMKDDKNGNDGSDTYTADDEYHRSNEVVKLKIEDGYYDDNQGRYYVSILKGVGYVADSDSRGILEFIARLVENTLLGDLVDGERQGGMIEYFYKSIVQDSTFITTLRAMLALYISFYGIAVIFGVASITKKELMGRVLKIGLILFFTSPASWSFYNDIVVGFFYDSLNYLVSVLTSLSGDAVDQSTTTQLMQAEISNGAIVSNASRFGYIDNVIMMLLSEAVAAKVFGLVFSDPLGILYVLIIYALIAGFVVVMMLALVTYLITIMKIIFVLSLGPIFFTFTLFSQTSGIFKNWLNFLISRAVEMMIMFFVLFSFVILINTKFNTLLNYRACIESINIAGFTVIKILKSYVNRNAVEWFSYFLSTAGMIYLTKLILDKIPDLANQLAKYDTDGNKQSQSSASAAKSAIFGDGKKPEQGEMGGILGIIKSGLSRIQNPAVYGANRLSSLAMGAARSVGNATGLSGIASKVSGMMPNINPRAMYRNSIIDAEIKRAQKNNGASEQGVRAAVMKAINNKKSNFDAATAKSLGIDQDPKTMALAGVSTEAVLKRLDEKLVYEPLRNQIKQISQNLKSSGDPTKMKFGKEFDSEVRKQAEAWIKNNAFLGETSKQKALEALLEKPKSSQNHLQKSMDALINYESKVSVKDAANALSLSPEKQKQFFQETVRQQLADQKRTEDARKGINSKISDNPLNVVRKAAGVLPAAGNMALNTLRSASRFESLNAAEKERSFLRQAENIEKDRFWSMANPAHSSNALTGFGQRLGQGIDYLKGKDSAPNLREQAKEARISATRDILKQDFQPYKPVAGLTAKETKAAIKEHDREDLRDRKFLQQNLREAAIAGDPQLKAQISEIRSNEAKGRNEEAKQQKLAMFENLRSELNSFMNGQDKPELTLFDKLAKVDNALAGVGQKTTMTETLADLMQKRAAENREKIAQNLKDKDAPNAAELLKESQIAAEENKILRSGLFADFNKELGNPENKTAEDLARERIAEELMIKMNSEIDRIKAEAELANDEKANYKGYDKYHMSEVDRELNLMSQEIAKESSEVEKSLQEFAQEVAQQEAERQKLVNEQLEKERIERQEIEKQQAEKQEVEKQQAGDNLNQNPDQLNQEQNNKEAQDREEAQRTEINARKIADEQEALTAVIEISKEINPEIVAQINENSEAKTRLIDDLEAKFDEKVKEIRENQESEEEKIRQFVAQSFVFGAFAKAIEEVTEAKIDVEKIIAESAEQQASQPLISEPTVPNNLGETAEIRTSEEQLPKAAEELLEARKQELIIQEIEMVQEVAKGKIEELVSNNEQLQSPATEDSNKLIPTSFEIQFGASITDALLKGPEDLGLKAGNPFLTQNSDNADSTIEAAKQMLQSQKKGNEVKMKSKEFVKKILEFEKEQLSKDPNANERRISEIDRELNEVGKEISTLERIDFKIDQNL